MKNELDNLREMLAIAAQLLNSYQSTLQTFERCWALERAAMKISHEKQRAKLQGELEQAQGDIQKLVAAIAATEAAQAQAYGSH